MRTVEATISEEGEVKLLEPLKLPGERRALVTILDEETDASLRPFGLCKGQFTVPDDFDDPLPDELLRAFDGS